jgi:cell division protein FtsI (penicillin-binding protein 3)
MMPVSLLAMLETGKAKLSDEVNTGSGVYPVDNEREMFDHNWRRGGYGTISLERVLEVSSNIGIGLAVQKTYGDNQQEFFNQLDKMSFGKPDNIEGIEGLKPTYYSSPKDSNWISRRIWWSAIGYERLMAPIQMLTFYNAIANNGKMVKPTMKTGKIEIINPQIASRNNIKVMQEVLEHVVSQGLGRKAGTPILKVAGKTGTSQVGEYDFREENNVNEYQLAFCGYFPADAPKYSIIVSMNKLGLPASGGGMAGVVFHYIVKWMITHGMPNLAIIDEMTNDTVRVTPNNVDSIISNSLKQD